MHSGYILLNKPNYDYSIRSSAGACTLFNFTNDFYRQWVSEKELKLYQNRPCATLAIG